MNSPFYIEHGSSGYDISKSSPKPAILEELETTLSVMEKAYTDKLRKANSDVEFDFAQNKIEFIQNMRLLLFVNKDREAFVRDMKK